MKRILYIATAPIHLKSGGGIANLALLNSLSKDYIDVIDVVHYEESINHETDKDFIGVPPQSKLKKIISFLKGDIHRFNPWLENFIKSNADKYSHCIINTGLLGDNIDILHKYGIKVAVVHHNYEVEFNLDNKRPSTLWGLTGSLIKRNEKKAYYKADMNLFLSADDITLFHKHYPLRFKEDDRLIGIFEPESVDSIIMDSHLNYQKLVICGSLDTVQTKIGLKDFVNKYSQILYEIYKERYNLVVTGRNPDREIYSLLSHLNNVQIIANPKEISDVVKNCGIFICPTNVGGGIKLRILDGLKLGLPILTHAVSARGYNNLHKYSWFKIYYDENSFRKGLEDIIREIVNNPNLRQEIINVYQDNFSFAKGDKAYREAIKDFLNLN